MRALWETAEHLARTRFKEDRDSRSHSFLFLQWCKSWHLLLSKALHPLQAAWVAFSQPVPTSCGHLLTQLLLCSSLAVAAAGLTHHWLVSSLLYPPGPSATVATVWGLLVFLVLGLVPPARCLFALNIPTLGTEQGRRLLLSWSTATLGVAVVPNVLANMGAAGQVLRCVTEGSLESLLNTTRQLHAASRALGPARHVGSHGLTLQAQGNGSVFRLHMLRVTRQVLEDFSSLESLARAAVFGTQQVVAGLFMMGLLVDSGWYLHRYLTDLRFDNNYVTRQLAWQLAETQATYLVASPPAWLLWAARPRLSQGELLSCLLRLGLLSLFLMVTAVMVATDHVAFLLAQAAVDWAQKLPAVPITLTVEYDATYTVLGFIFFLFNQPPPESLYLSAHNSFQWELRFTSPGCPLLPAQSPHTTACLTAGALQLVAGATVLLETYARRLRHTIAASFFSAQEARRVHHLHARLQRRYERHGGQRLPLGPPSSSQTPVYQHAPSLDRQANHTLATGRNREHAAEG
ncbi:osteoclast stimulatory transmembrane protein [Lutra lutra]|uniref:osteoclast stimulatory transmembrane protein n=1 Tax=Lutra lutra TaxID=9657 RepID=UPI001FD20789|nr:osteoclast stimulatory transmembrane protein [Lutra lutra]